jgi:asparagine synthase (glutamine-hydrolysing)
MSAIAGILGRVDDPANRAAIGRMMGAMVHRGPDGEGTFASRPDERGHGCLLAHRKLRVLDATDQPVSRGPHTLAADASIFTHPAAADVLRELSTNAPAALKQFRGMFAIALWDESTRQLLLARDPLGHKPLYFIHNTDPAGSWSFAFASEVRALIASELFTPRLDPVGVASMVWNGFVMSPATMVQGVQSIFPGEWRSFDIAGKEIKRDWFWSMPRTQESTSDESVIRGELRESVRLAMRTDSSARLGVCLSAGIDSSSMANLAQQQRGGAEPIHTFCLAMEEASLNEGSAAREIAGVIGSQHDEVMLTEQRFVDCLDDAIASLDQPTFDALNQYHICRALRDEGMSAAISGVGGDAIFGGDKTLRQLPRLRQVARLTGWLPESLRVGGAKMVTKAKQKKVPPGSLGSQQNWAKLPDVVRANGDLLGLYQLTYALFLPSFQEELLAKTASSVRYGLPPATHEWLSRETADRDAIDVAAILETRCFVGERLLRDADTVSSALSFELRSPLSDARIIEALAPLPHAQKYLPVGSKPLLRKYGLEGLDKKLFERPKSGFVLPFDRWIRKNLGRVMNEVMLDERACAAAGLRGEAVGRLWRAFQEGAPGIYWTRVWAIYVLIRWCHRYRVLV